MLKRLLEVKERSLKDIPYRVQRIWLGRVFDIPIATIFLSAGFGIVFGAPSFPSSWVAKFIPVFFDTILILGILALGTALYVFRCRHLLSYGAIELVVGLVIAIYAVNMIVGRVTPSAAALFTVLGALYIIVRGYDNLYRSLEEKTDHKRLWNRVFFGKDTDEKIS